MATDNELCELCQKTVSYLDDEYPFTNPAFNMMTGEQSENYDSVEMLLDKLDPDDDWLMSASDRFTQEERDELKVSITAVYDKLVETKKFIETHHKRWCEITGRAFNAHS